MKQPRSKFAGKSLAGWLIAPLAAIGVAAPMKDFISQPISAMTPPTGRAPADPRLPIRPPAADSLHSTLEAESSRWILLSAKHDVEPVYSVQIQGNEVTDILLPSLSQENLIPPTLTADISPRDMNDVGLALPLLLTFSEPLAERKNVGQHIAVRSTDGQEISGRWEWVGKRKVRFSPQPLWPANSTIHVSADRQGLRSSRGGALDAPLESQFSTGPDKRIFVYLDKQRVTAVENGQVVRVLPASTGKAGTPTATGSFYIYDRYPHKTMRSRGVPRGKKGYYEVENVPYTQFFHEDLAFHGAWWHNRFGHPASHGCVNLSTQDHNKRWPDAPEDAGWLYRWAALGVPVTVLKDTPVDVALE
ncbi:MAG: L,D-transpeptidase [Methylococcaceae bacterium]|nr:L,D-transpeptidase [Methylococcaceae bacterium]